ncbi:hypothetical protein L249_3589, partial [Ophiocordyceps polyrhachis-furcata BCC 54312]
REAYRSVEEISKTGRDSAERVATAAAATAAADDGFVDRPSDHEPGINRYSRVREAGTFLRHRRAYSSLAHKTTVDRLLLCPRAFLDWFSGVHWVLAYFCSTVALYLPISSPRTRRRVGAKEGDTSKYGYKYITDSECENLVNLWGSGANKHVEVMT